MSKKIWIGFLFLLFLPILVFASSNKALASHSISSISPSSVPAGSPDTLLTVTGSGFASNSFISLDGIGVTTTFVSSATLRTTISSANLASPTTYSIGVFNPSEGTLSNTRTFTVTAAPPPAPSLDHFSFDSIGTQTTGIAFNITIRARDASNNTVTSFAGPVSLTVSSGTISPTTSGAFSSGVWTGSVTLGGTGSTRTITATGGGKTGTSSSFTVNAPATPPTPTGVTASASGSTVTVNWNAVVPATGYKIYRNGVFRADDTSSPFTDSSVSPGSHNYTVSAVNITTEGSQSSSANVTIIGRPSISDTEESSVTLNSATLRADINPNGASTTAWFRYSTANPSGCDDTFGTRVPASQGSDPNVGSGFNNQNTSQNISSLTENTRYYFCALARNSIDLNDGPVESFYTLPDAPEGLTAGNIGPAGSPPTPQVRLNWTASTSAGVTYKIFRKTTTSGYSEIGSTPAGATTYTDSVGLVDGWTYLYKVSAVGAGGATADSNEVTIIARNTTQCDDDIDNDGDGEIDEDDPACRQASDNDESADPEWIRSIQIEGDKRADIETNWTFSFELVEDAPKGTTFQIDWDWNESHGDEDFEYSCGASWNTEQSVIPAQLKIWDHDVCEWGHSNEPIKIRLENQGGVIPADTKISYTATFVENPKTEGPQRFRISRFATTDPDETPLQEEDVIVELAENEECVWFDPPGGENKPSCFWQLPRIFVEFIADFFIQIIRAIFGILIGFVVYLIKGIMALDVLVPGGAARNGFAVTMQVANIGLVLAIIVIGFATILHRESYGMRKALPRLLIVAVLINFSLYFAGVFIGLSNALTNVFLDGITDLSFELPTEGTDQFIGGFTGFLAVLFSPFFEILFQILLLFALIATLVMFLIRYVWLSILVIGLPLVLVLTIFPNLKVGGASGAWDTWLEKFTNWLLFGPVAAFFLWLAFLLNSEADPTFINMIVTIAILVYGLTVAQKLGLSGSETAGKMAGWATRRAALYAGKATGYFKPHGAGDHGAEAAHAPAAGPAAAPAGTPRLDLREEAHMPGAVLPSAEAAKPAEPQMRFNEMLQQYEEVPPATPAAAEPEAEPTRMDKFKKFAKETTKGITGVEPTREGLQHWAEGGDTIKDIIKPGVKELLGDMTHGPFKGLFGHTKGEENEEKLGKISKFLDGKLAEEKKFFKELKEDFWTDEQLYKYRYEMKPEEKRTFFREEIEKQLVVKYGPKGSASFEAAKKKVLDLGTVINSAQSAKTKLEVKVIEDREGLTEAKGGDGGAHPPKAPKAASSGGGGGHAH